MAAAGFDQVLLQRFDTEGVGHLEVGGAAIGAWRVDPELLALTEEARVFLVALEAHLVEVAEHARTAGFLHRQLVM
ncbi:hypothetical protein FQZ97_789180 [compost metagenome]